jgi:hypothetical protein
MVSRRNFLKSAGAAPLLASVGLKSANADVPVHRWDGYDLGTGPQVKDRLNQGPFGIDQDQGWRNIGSTSPSDKLGLCTTLE